MLRIVLLLFGLLPVGCAFSQEQHNFRIELFGSSTYLLFAQQHTPVEQATNRLHTVCVIPHNPSTVSFVFADGDVHNYTTETIKRNASFAVLLKGSERLQFRRRGLAGLLRIRSKPIHGDTALLRKLQTKDLDAVRYEHEDVKYYDGAPEERFVSNVIMHLTKKEMVDLRKKANGIKP